MYVNIWITGGSRTLFSRPMGERGSSHQASVIQVFAYAGYKRGVRGRVKWKSVSGGLNVVGSTWKSLLLFWARLTCFFFCRALDFGSRVGFGATSRRILGPVAVNDKEGRARCEASSPRPRNCADGTERGALLPPPRPNERAYGRAGARHELGGGRKEGRRTQGSPFLFLFIGFV